MSRHNSQSMKRIVLAVHGKTPTKKLCNNTNIAQCRGSTKGNIVTIPNSAYYLLSTENIVIIRNEDSASYPLKNK